MKTYQVKIPASLKYIKNKKVVIYTNDNFLEKNNIILNVNDNIEICQFQLDDKFTHNLDDTWQPTFCVKCVYNDEFNNQLIKRTLTPIQVN